MKLRDVFVDPEGNVFERDDGTAIPAFLTDPVGVVRRRWVWMLGALLLGLMGTAAAWSSWSPSYVATATIQISDSEIPDEFIRSTVREDTIQNISGMIGNVLSQRTLAKLIEDIGIYEDLRDELTMLDLVKKLRSGVTIGPMTDRRGRRQDTSLIYAVEFRSDRPEHTAEVANALASLLIDAGTRRRTEQAELTTDFLRQELARDENELRAQAARVSSFRTEHRGELPEELTTNTQKLAMLEQRRESLVAQIAERERRGFEGPTEPGSPNELLLEELRRSLAREVAAHTDEHPNVLALRRQIEGIEALVKEERIQRGGGQDPALRYRAEREHDLARLRQSLRQIEETIVEVNGKIDRTPARAQELAALEQRATVLREDYLQTLRKVEEAELAESLESAQQGARISILDPAVRASSVARPRWTIAATGLAFALALSVGAAVLLEILDPVVVRTSQLEELTGSPVLGSFPRF